MSIGYALCTMHRVVIEAFACASRRVRTCMRCKSGRCPPIRCAKPRVNSVIPAVPSDKRASHLMMKKCTAQSHKQSRVGMCPCTRVLTTVAPHRTAAPRDCPKAFEPPHEVLVLVPEGRQPTTPTMVGQEVNKKWDLLSRHLEDTRHETCYANF